MNKISKKLILRSESIRALASSQLQRARGAGPASLPGTNYATCASCASCGGATCAVVCPWPPGGGGGSTNCGGDSDVCGTENTL